MKVRERSIQVGAGKKKKMAKDQNDIERSIAMLEKQLDSSLLLTTFNDKPHGSNLKQRNREE